jgi:hypothetical protein
MIDGLYKVRLGSYSNIQTAGNELNAIKEAGFSDSFIVETTYSNTPYNSR